MAYYCQCNLVSDNMKIVSLFVTLWAVLDSGSSVSSKMDFGEDTSYTVTNSTVFEDDEDLEVKHVISVETSFKNSNNRRGLHGPNTGIQRKGSPKHKKENKNEEDSGEVPVVMGWKAVETTAIKTPDTRLKPPESVFINRNIRDEYDVYPNVAYSNPSQWMPSVYYNNINLWNQQMRNPGFSRRIDRPESLDPVKLSKKISDDSMRDFYCKRCAELNGMKSCSQRKIQTTTPKMKIDGKLAKLN